MAPWLERLKFLTPLPGIEPGTKRLTVVRSTADPKRKDWIRYKSLHLCNQYYPEVGN